MEKFVNYYELFDNTEEVKNPLTFEEKVSEILYHYDPAGLAALYLPEDEYDSEARAIIGKLRDVESAMAIKWIVYDVFEDFFGRDGTSKSAKMYRRIAEEIWEVWQEEIRIEL